MVSRRLPDRRARQSADHLSRRGAQGRCRGSSLVHGDARSHQPGRHAGNRHRVLRRQASKADPGSKRGGAGRVVGAKSKAVVELRNRQAPQGSWQRKRPRRPLHDVASCGQHLGDVRRGYPESHGHGWRAVHVLRALPQDQFGSSFVTAGFALKTADLANSRGDLFGPELADYMKRAARNLTGIKAFGEEQPNMENRVELASEKDAFGMPMGRLTHSFDQDAVALWNANLEEGLKVAKASGAKEAWSSRAMPTSHLLG